MRFVVKKLSLFILFSLALISNLSAELDLNNCKEIHGISEKIESRKKEIKFESEFYKKIHEAYKVIFSTPKSHYYILNKLFLCDPKLAKIFLGLKEEHVLGILKNCKNKNFLVQKESFSYTETQSNERRNLLKYQSKRRYFYIENKSYEFKNNMDFYSWSNRQETIFFDINISQEKIISALAHELGIVFDLQFQYQNYFMDKILGNLLSPSRKMSNLSIAKVSSDFQYHDLLSSPVIQSSFATLRAFLFELELVQEVARFQKKNISEFYDLEFLNFINSKSCHKKLDKIIQELKPFSLSIWKSTVSLQALSGQAIVYDKKTQTPMFYYRWDSDFFPLTCQEATHRTNSNFNQFKTLDPNQSLCEEITKVELGISYKSRTFYGGPRPRISGGW